MPVPPVLPPGARLRVSAIVPALDEEDAIEACIQSLRAGLVDEVLVADGGSRDRTVARAERLADRVLHARGGLFPQLNAAARQASGDVLLFHYADVLFPAGGRSAIDRALESPAVEGGSFTLAFASDRRAYRVIARGASLRNRLGLGPFGDQSIFVRAAAFRSLEGFQAGAFLEDLHLVRRLKRRGEFRIVEERVRASVRRWEKNGVLPTLLAHWWLTFLYATGLGRGMTRAAAAARSLRLVR